MNLWSQGPEEYILHLTKVLCNIIILNLGRKGNFGKANTALVTDFGNPYDYQSILHYRK